MGSRVGLACFALFLAYFHSPSVSGQSTEAPTTLNRADVNSNDVKANVEMEKEQPKKVIGMNSVTNRDSVVKKKSLPDKVMGFYLPLANDDKSGYEADKDWYPELYPYQQKAGNVLFFSFVNPHTMIVPAAFQNLANSRGSDNNGSVPANTIIIFTIGMKINTQDNTPWPWLKTPEDAMAMAAQVANWSSLYGCDGIGVDLGENADGSTELGSNLFFFLDTLRSLNSDIIITQPAPGYPYAQLQGITDVINFSWNTTGSSTGLINAVGLEVYHASNALNFVDNYANTMAKWQGYPININVPKSSILLGCKGGNSGQAINTLAQASFRGDLRGLVVWYASVKNGLKYRPSWDASSNSKAQDLFVRIVSTK